MHLIMLSAFMAVQQIGMDKLVCKQLPTVCICCYIYTHVRIPASAVLTDFFIILCNNTRHVR